MDEEKKKKLPIFKKKADSPGCPAHSSKEELDKAFEEMDELLDEDEPFQLDLDFFGPMGPSGG
jgi:hypothetical protein